MKKLFISMFVAVVAFTLWSCGPANTPSAVAEEACKCVQNEDYEGYVELMDLKETKNKESEKQQFVAMLREKGTKTMEKKQGIKSYKVESEEISEDGKSAIVKMKVVYGDGSEDTNKIKLVKNDKGEWKVSLGK